jgi:hypothetical protein
MKMKKISIILMVLVVALASCKKTPEVNLKYVDVERDLVTVGTTTANIQCDYAYITTLKKAYLYYGEGESETNMTSAEMRVVQNTLYEELTGLKENTTYSYYYEFHNGFNSMRTALKSFKTETSPITPPEIMLPTVITAEVTGITTNSAQCGGEVTNDGGAEVTERGICWSTTPNPTLDDSHIAAGSGMGAFTVVMSGLEANTTYHVRAYAINEEGTAYGLDKEFTTLVGGGSGDHEWVDLGLPSGTLWATCNVGANSPEDYGDYFAWGETQPKDYYDWSNYLYCNGSVYTLTKYCTVFSCGYNGFTDNLITLLPEDDAATINWGIDWHTPTVIEWYELYENTTHIWSTQNGVNGQLFTASNGNNLFLPAAGIRGQSSLENEGRYGYYWYSTLATGNPNSALELIFYSSDFLNSYNARIFGASVRPVRSAMKN